MVKTIVERPGGQQNSVCHLISEPVKNQEKYQVPVTSAYDKV